MIVRPDKKVDMEMDVMSDQEAGSRDGRWVQIGRLVPSWIQALAAVAAVLVGAGIFVVGHATAAGKPAPTATVFVTVTPTPRGSDHPSQQASAASAGVKLASYSVAMPPFYTIPLGSTRPTPGQFVRGASETSGDLYLDTSGFGPGTDFQPENSDKMVILPNGSVLTYKSCSADSGFVQNVNNASGAVFCLIESSGNIVGVSIQSIDSSQPYASVLGVTVWKGSS
jgi:hypothetical protein